MTTNNGWPGKPGVPLNPEKDGWHWVSGNDGDPEPFYWNGIWQGSDQFSYYSLGESCRYFGPVLTPAEATELQARADRNAAGFARVDAEAERAKFLHKQEIAALQKRVAELEAALDFYACVDHYQTHNAVAPNVVQFDRGAKARAALEGGKDE